MSSSQTYIEDEIGRKWDHCISDGVLKMGGGFFLGAVFSVLFFKRRAWPVFVGSGFGVGVAYSNCEKDLNASIKNAPC